MLLEFPPYVEELQERLCDLHKDLRQKDARVKQLELEINNSKCQFNTNTGDLLIPDNTTLWTTKQYRGRRGRSNTYRGHRRGSKI